MIVSQAFEFYSAKIPQADMHPPIYSYKMGGQVAMGTHKGIIYIYIYLRCSKHL